MKKLLPVLIVLLLCSCTPWIKTAGNFVSESQDFAVDLPEGWMRRNIDKLFLITRDGAMLQKIVIFRKDVTEEKQFAYTKKRITLGMLPQEMAEVIIDDFQSDTNNPVEAVEENLPMTIAAEPGFRLRITYNTGSGLRYRHQVYGFISGRWFYQIIYVAPARHYFDKDLATVESMVKTFRLARK